MELNEAIHIVLDLATQNIVDEQENPEEYTRQCEACDEVESWLKHAHL